MRQITPFKTHNQIANLIAELLKGQGTRIELVERTGLDRNYLSRLIAALKNKGCVHIVGWQRDPIGRHIQAVFTLGSGEDAPRPPVRPRKDRDAQRNRKKKEQKKVEQIGPIKTRLIGGSLWVQ